MLLSALLFVNALQNIRNLDFFFFLQKVTAHRTEHTHTHTDQTTDTLKQIINLIVKHV